MLVIENSKKSKFAWSVNNRKRETCEIMIRQDLAQTYFKVSPISLINHQILDYTFCLTQAKLIRNANQPSKLTN